jgi:cytoskeletal protein CcmA (bactofilin family)
MALVLKDRVKETTTTSGTGTYTLAGAETGFEAFSSIGNTNTTYYCCTDGTDFEIGIGTYTLSGTTLARTTILQSSNSDSAVNWASGSTRTIFCTYPGDKSVFLNASNQLVINGTDVTSTAAELNILDGVTSTAAELNILDGVTATATELNLIDGVTATTAELNYNDTGSAVGTVVASKTVTADANKDVASFRNITLTGELDAGSLDVSGNADIDGTLEADAITVDGTALATFIRDTVGTNMLSSNTESGITVTYDTTNDNIDFAIDAAQTGITSLLATDIKIGEDDQTKIDFETADEIHFYANNASLISLTNANSGDAVLTVPTADKNFTVKGTDSSSAITALDIDMAAAGDATFNNKVIAAELDISGDVDVDGTLEADAITVDGTALNTVIAGVTVTNATTAAVATTVTISDNESTNEENAIIFTAGGDVDGGNIGLESDGDLAYNPSTGTVSATIFKGNIDAVDGDFDGTLEADAITLDGTAITATATLSTGISNNNVPKFTSGVADNDFLRVDGTAIEGRSASEVLSDIGASAAAGSSSIVTTGALDAGSITSGFGTIDTGSSTANFGATTVDSLDVSDGNITNVGSIALDSIASDAGTGTAITFGAGNVPNTQTAGSQGGSTAPDFSQYTNFIWTLTSNLVLTDPGDEVAGQSGIFVFIQDGTGSRTLSHAADQYFVAGGTSITLTTAANAIDIVPYFVQADGKIHLGAAQLAFAEA